MHPTYIFLDTETTGIAPERGVVEVAFIITDENFNVLSEHASLIDPEQPISAAASGVHGLTEYEVANAPTLAEYFSNAGAECYGGLLPGPAVVIGHRIGFDTHTIGRYIDGGFTEICTLRWARKLFPTADNHQLSTLIFALGLPRSAGAHRALADVYSAYHLCKVICETTGMTLAQLAEASAAPMLLANVPFGKHKDQPFADVPRSYLQWMQREMKDLDADMKHTLDFHINKKNKKKD